MREVELLHKHLSMSLPGIHSSRMNCLMSGVRSSFDAKNMTLTALGRASKGEAKVKNKIKRIDRLLGNPRLHNEINDIYNAMSNLIIGNKKHPIIIIDWASVDRRAKFEVLKATVAYEGRSITILDRVEYKNRGTKKTNNSHDKFIDDLDSIIPSGCQPIIIADAAFGVKWFKRVEAKGWYWIGRLRGAIKIRRINDNKELSCVDLFKLATTTPKSLGEHWLSKGDPIKRQLFIYKNPPKGRVRKNINGTRKAAHIRSDYAKCAKEPWLLSTNLPKSYNQASKIIKCYAKRMQIEETFRDNKSANYGLGIKNTLSETKERVAILILIAALALLLLGILGKAAYENGLYKQFQANTIRHRKVLSLWYLGQQIYEHLPNIINPQSFKTALLNLLEGIHTYEYL